MSFEAIKRKLKKYRKKNKKDTSLEFLEYSLELESDEENKGERGPLLVPNSQLNEEYQLL